MNNYRNRQERLAYLRANFGPYLRARVLDVGCDQAYLRDALGRAHYVGIDLYGRPDVLVNLEQVNLPFGDSVFDCVVCLDVLEHLEHIHALSDEIVRVARQYLIISLPNPVGQYWPRLVRGGGQSVHYGLPSVPPADRHRWFFNYEEGKAFLLGMARKHHLSVERLIPVPLIEEAVWWKAVIKQAMKRIIAHGGDRYLNLGTQAIWAVLQKPT
jgi:SAM-dependent methyltransferase